MHALAGTGNDFGTTLDDVFFVARRVLGLLKDPRSNATRLGRLIDAVSPLADEVLGAAEHLFADRGRVVSTAHAITLLGFDRLERVVRRFLHVEFARLAAERAADPTAPSTPSHPGTPRYAAL